MPDFQATTDLCDAHPEAQVLAPVFLNFGGRARFVGRAVTLRVQENNPLVRAALQTSGQGRVLIVDGGGSLNCALLGGMLGEFGVQNGWEGVVINGCVRDTAELQRLDLGIRALAAHPRRSGRLAQGEQGVILEFAGATICPNGLIYADEDGVVVLPA